MSTVGDASNPVSPNGVQPGSSGYQSGSGHDPEPGPSGYQPGSAIDPEPGPSRYQPGSDTDPEPGPSRHNSGQLPTSNQNRGFASGSGLHLEPEPGPSGYQAASNYSDGQLFVELDQSSSSQHVRESSGLQPAQSGYDQFVVDDGESVDDDADAGYLQVVTESFDQEPGPSDFEPFQAEPEADHNPEARPSEYPSASQAGAYHRGNDDPVDLPDHGLLLDNEPGPSGLNQSRNSPVEESGPSGYQNEPGPSNYSGEALRDNREAGNRLIELIHGEISNPPSPLGGRVVHIDSDSDDEDLSLADSLQGRSGRIAYFGLPFMPDAGSNPSSPQAGPSFGPAKRRNVQADSYNVFGNGKRSRFEPTPGPSNSSAQHHQQRNHLNVSRSALAHPLRFLVLLTEL